jgi:hypothetical protein
MKKEFEQNTIKVLNKTDVSSLVLFKVFFERGALDI